MSLVRCKADLLLLLIGTRWNYYRVNKMIAGKLANMAQVRRWLSATFLKRIYSTHSDPLVNIHIVFVTKMSWKMPLCDNV